MTAGATGCEASCKRRPRPKGANNTYEHEFVSSPAGVSKNGHIHVQQTVVCWLYECTEVYKRNFGYMRATTTVVQQLTVVV